MERWQRSAKILIVNLLKIITTLLKIITTLVAMSAVPSASNDNGSEDDHQEEPIESLGE